MIEGKDDKNDKKKEEDEEGEVEKNGKQKDKKQEDEEVVRLMVQPEVRLPELDADGSTLRWKPSDAAHPLWVIKRNAHHFDANAEIVLRDANHVMACGYLDLSSSVLDVPATTSTFKVLMPFIRNTQPIEAGKEVILKWRPTPKRPPKRQADKNAFDQIKMAEIQRKKTKKDNESAAVA